MKNSWILSNTPGALDVSIGKKTELHRAAAPTFGDRGLMELNRVPAVDKLQEEEHRAQWDSLTASNPTTRKYLEQNTKTLTAYNNINSSAACLQPTTAKWTTKKQSERPEIDVSGCETHSAQLTKLIITIGRRGNLLPSPLLQRTETQNLSISRAQTSIICHRVSISGSRPWQEVAGWLSEVTGQVIEKTVWRSVNKV